MSGCRGQAHCIWSSGIAADDLPTGSFFGGPSSHARFSQNRHCHSSCTGRKPSACFMAFSVVSQTHLLVERYEKNKEYENVT